TRSDHVRRLPLVNSAKEYNCTNVDCSSFFLFVLGVELYATIDNDIQWAMQNGQGELDFANLAAYMNIKVDSQKEKSHLIV
ncbi:hypothetical protein PHET_08772, partial [Paragonimus heterotremus]